MFRFQHPDTLHYLWIIPVIIVLFILLMQWKKSAIKKYGDSKILSKLMPEVSSGRQWFKFLLFLSAVVMMVLGLANPQIGSKLEKTERKGIDIIVALDVSNSMLSQDIKPNRLERARQYISRLIDKVGNDRIGIIAFAGKAYPTLPLTDDLAAAKMFLSRINTDYVPTQGTSIADAIDLALRSFREGDYGKALIIITDGEDHEGEVMEKVRKAADDGIVIHTVGMGSPEGSPIPLYIGGNQVGFRKTKDGQTVITRLNEAALQQIAAAGNGVYVRSTNTQAGLQRIHSDLERMQKTEFDSRTFSEYDSRYYYFLALALILLIIEILFSERSSRFIKRLKYFIPLVFLVFSVDAQAQSDASMVRKGNKKYINGDYKNAEVDYRKALEKDPRSCRGAYNLGNAIYRQDNFEEAANSYLQSAMQKTDDASAARIFHNLGNSMLKANKIAESIDAYKNALRINPHDDDTRYNLAYAMKMQQQQQGGESQDNKDNKDQKDQKDQQQNNQQQGDQKQEENPTEQQQNQSQQPKQISKQEAERMLQALTEQEQKTLDKVKKENLKNISVRIEKDW